MYQDKASEEGKEVFPVILENGSSPEQIKNLDAPKLAEPSQNRSIEAAELPLNTASSSENQPIVNPVKVRLCLWLCREWNLPKLETVEETRGNKLCRF